MQDTPLSGSLTPIRRCAAVLLFGLLLLPAPGAAESLEVPVEAAAGPALLHLDRPRFDTPPNRLAEAQPWVFALRFDVALILDREWAEQHPAYVPPQHRARIERAGEVRYAPPSLSLLPRSLIVSPKVGDLGAYGATWELLSIGAGTGWDWIRFRAGASAIFTYTFFHGETLQKPFHFLRPGIDLEANIHIPLDDVFALTVGWTSNVYLPQTIGGGLLDFLGSGNSLWHTGEGFLLVHYKFPYEVSL